MMMAPPSSEFFDWPYLPPRMTQADLDAHLLHASRFGVTDFHLWSARPIKVKLHSYLYDATQRRMEFSEVSDLLGKVLGEQAPATLGKGEDADGEYSIKVGPIRHRFRVNATRITIEDQPGIHITFRIHPNIPPALSELALPPKLEEKLLGLRKGLVVVTGAVGSGKTTLLAAFLRQVLEDPSRHEIIVEFASPTEFIFDDVESANSVAFQSQIGRDIPSWARAVRNSLRRGPTIVVAQETRAREEMDAALTAAKTAALTLCTVHTTGVAETISRIVNMYPDDQKRTVYADLVSSLQLIVSQALLPATDGTRVAVREWLALNVPLKTALQDLPPDRTTNTLRTFVATGGQPFQHDADELLRQGRITPETHHTFLESYGA